MAAWGGGVEAGQGGLGIPHHGGGDRAFVVVLIEVNAQVFGACPVMQDDVVLGEHLHAVFSMLLADVLDAKIINAKSKRDGAPFVSPKNKG